VARCQPCIGSPLHLSDWRIVMTVIEINLEFEADEVTEADVYNYINELIENNSLSYEVK
jgi:hypothetical protein